MENTNKRTRRTYSPEYKLRISEESKCNHKHGDIKKIAQRENLQPQQIYNWRKTVENSAEVIFGKKRNYNFPVIADESMKDLITKLIDENNKLNIALAQYKGSNFKIA